MNYTLSYTSNAGSVTFGFDSGIIISRFDTFGGIDTDFETAQNASGYGDKVESMRVRPVNITVSGSIVGDSAEKRNALYRAFVPMQAGKLLFNGQWYMDVYVKKSPNIERYDRNPAFSMMLYAPVPYWRNVGGTASRICGVDPLFSFPVTWGSPIRFSEAFGGRVNVPNDGDAPCPWEMTMTARSEITNPTVTKIATGEFVRVNTTLQEGQQLILSTIGDEMNAVVAHPDGTEVNLFDRIDIDSTRFALTQGDNVLEVTPNSNDLSAVILYYKMLAGV